MATQINLKYCGMEGTGPTVKAAKADAARKIEKVLEGNWSPRILEYRGLRMLLYREPNGWHANFLRDDTYSFGSCTGGEFEEVKARAYYNLLTAAWVPADGDTVPEAMTIVWGRAYAREWSSEYKRWVRFQLLFRAAKRRGLDHHDCHNIGCGCIGRPDLVAIAEECETEVEVALAAGPSVLATF